MRRLLALCLTLPVVGCSTSGNVAVAPDLPELPAELVVECPDPGVRPIATVGNAVTVISENRLYAACSRRKHRDVVGFYQNVRSEYTK